eukprot:464665_1
MHHMDQTVQLQSKFKNCKLTPRESAYWKPELNLAAEDLGSEVLYATDEWFAPAANLLKDGRGVWIEDKYTENGKWMDGWESRRHGSYSRGGVDSCYIKLGCPGRINKVDIDTNHFTGNYACFASISVCNVPGDPAWFYVRDEKWTELLPKTKLDGGAAGEGHNIHSITNSGSWTHLRLDIYPDGGVARLKVFGEATPDFSTIPASQIINLADVRLGAKPVSCSNMFFSSPWNLILPGRAENMASGWETQRSREKDHCDWVILALGSRGTIDAVEVDTTHFKGNYPHLFEIHGVDLEDGATPIGPVSSKWTDVVEQTKGQAHSRMVFRASDLKFEPRATFTHLKLTVYPDGGLSRLRVYGRRVPDQEEEEEEEAELEVRPGVAGAVNLQKPRPSELKSKSCSFAGGGAGQLF